MKKLAIAALLLSSFTGIAHAGENEYEQWQCYSYSPYDAFMADRWCMQKAYEATQLLNKPARCQLDTSNYCTHDGFFNSSHYFAVVWSKN